MQWLTGLPEVERWTHGKFLCCNAGLWVGGGGSCCCMFYVCLWATLDSRLTIPHSWTLCNPLVQDLQLALHALILLRNARLLLLLFFLLGECHKNVVSHLSYEVNQNCWTFWRHCLTISWLRTFGLFKQHSLFFRKDAFYLFFSFYELNAKKQLWVKW